MDLNAGQKQKKAGSAGGGSAKRPLDSVPAPDAKRRKKASKKFLVRGSRGFAATAGCPDAASPSYR